MKNVFESIQHKTLTADSNWTTRLAKMAKTDEPLNPPSRKRDLSLIVFVLPAPLTIFPFLHTTHCTDGPKELVLANERPSGPFIRLRVVRV